MRNLVSASVRKAGLGLRAYNLTCKGRWRTNDPLAGVRCFGKPQPSTSLSPEPLQGAPEKPQVDPKSHRKNDRPSKKPRTSF